MIDLHPDRAVFIGGPYHLFSRPVYTDTPVIEMPCPQERRLIDQHVGRPQTYRYRRARTRICDYLRYEYSP
jgi:hypothetical protein